MSVESKWRRYDRRKNRLPMPLPIIVKTEKLLVRMLTSWVRMQMQQQHASPIVYLKATERGKGAGGCPKCGSWLSLTVVL